MSFHQPPLPPPSLLPFSLRSLSPLPQICDNLSVSTHTIKACKILHWPLMHLSVVLAVWCMHLMASWKEKRMTELISRGLLKHKWHTTVHKESYAQHLCVHQYIVCDTACISTSAEQDWWDTELHVQVYQWTCTDIVGIKVWCSNTCRCLMVIEPDIILYS